jgi:hypothetical protein
MVTATLWTVNGSGDDRRKSVLSGAAASRPTAQAAVKMRNKTLEAMRSATEADGEDVQRRDLGGLAVVGHVR